MLRFCPPDGPPHPKREFKGAIVFGGNSYHCDSCVRHHFPYFRRGKGTTVEYHPNVLIMAVGMENEVRLYLTPEQDEIVGKWAKRLSPYAWDGPGEQSSSFRWRAGALDLGATRKGPKAELPLSDRQERVVQDFIGTLTYTAVDADGNPI